jgi:membrane protease subunit HflC
VVVGRVAALFSLALILLAVFSVTIIESGQSAVLIRTGADQPRVISSPGVYWRIPFIERVWLIDTRLQTTEQIEPQPYILADQQTLDLSVWMAWRVTDPVRFQAMGITDKGALDERLRKTLSEAFATWTRTQSASGILKGQVSLLSNTGLTDLNQRLNALGVEAVQAGLRQVGLANAESEAIFARMSASKNRNSRQLIDGLTADERQLVALQSRQQTQVLDEAYRVAQQSRQRAEQQLLGILGRQYGQPNSFAETLRNPPRESVKADH